jgi:hypothetical protein
VEVTAIRAPSEFVGRVERVFSDWGDRGEITGGHAFDLLNGREKLFKKDEII